MKLKIVLISVLFTISAISCTKDKTNLIGYDSSFIDLVEYNSSFEGEWKSANQSDEFYLYFDILANGNSHYVSDYKSDDLPMQEINKKAKYNDGFIYLEDQMKLLIHQPPIASYDTIEQYNVNGPIKYVYSAKMIIENTELYRVEEIIY